jgi:hypothetical protein
MPPDMPPHDRAGRHAASPFSPGEFRSALSQKPRKPHRVQRFHPNTAQPQRENQNPARSRPRPNVNGPRAHHPAPVGFARTVPATSPAGQFLNGKHNSSSPRSSLLRGSWRALDRGNRPAPPRKGTRHLFLMFLMRFHATLCGIGAVVGSRHVRTPTVNRTDTPPSTNDEWSDCNAGWIQSGQIR